MKFDLTKQRRKNRVYNGSMSEINLYAVTQGVCRQILKFISTHNEHSIDRLIVKTPKYKSEHPNLKAGMGYILMHTI